jgi:hypothetical protein
MKIPSDEEIEEEARSFKGHSFLLPWADGAMWMRDQLKPLLDLVEQLRAARKECESEGTENQALERYEELAELRDQLELG